MSNIVNLEERLQEKQRENETIRARDLIKKFETLRDLYRRFTFDIENLGTTLASAEPSAQGKSSNSNELTP